MKLLFDENLSPQLPRLLSDLYPGSAHVAASGFVRTGDLGIWRYAKEFDFIVTTKDTTTSNDPGPAEPGVRRSSM